MKKILLLADVNSPHTQKWCIALRESGYRVAIFSLRSSKFAWHHGIEIYNCNFSDRAFHSGILSKIMYLKALPYLQRIIKKFRPDILHAHYATSYGLIGSLTGFHPFLVSCWGSDVIDFPSKGIFNKQILKFVFSRADRILATSKAIRNVVKENFNCKTMITPFGVDLKTFYPRNVNSYFNESVVVIGTIKSLEKIYCIDTLLEAFAVLKKKYTFLRLLIVGSGTQEQNLRILSQRLEIEDYVLFAGQKHHNEIAAYHNMIDIFVNVSEYESFGVSVLEAMASEKPVIVSDTGGLAEIINSPGIGVKIPARNSGQLSEELEKLILNPELRARIGKAARQHVEINYDLKMLPSIINSIYASV